MPESMLPSAMQDRRAQLLAEQQALEAQQQQPPQDNQQQPPQNVEQQPPQNNTQVTLTREEFNKLQSDADLSTKRSRELEQARLDLEEAEARLTSGADGSKGSPAPRQDAPQGPQAVAYELAPSDQVELTADEREDYDEKAIRVITKVVNRILNERLPKFAESVNGNLTAVRSFAEETGTNVSKNLKQVRAKEFDTKLRGEVDDIGTLVNHPDWVAFLESTQKSSGDTYREIFIRNFERQNIDVLKGVFDDFRKKYIGDTADTTSGYESVSSSGTSAAPGNPNEKVMLKMSDRRKAQKEFISRTNGMTIDKLDAIKEEFNKAEKENRIIYD